MFRAIAAAAITLVFAGQALAQDARPLHPLSSAADIRAGRSQSSSELLLSYRFIDEGGGESRRSIGLGADYAYMVAGRLLTIVDTRVNRMFVVDRGANTFSSESFHSLVSARSMDLDDRVETYQDKLKAAGRFAPPGLEDPFWIETDAGMTSPDLPRPQLGRTPVPNGGMQYRYRNESVARFTPAESDVSEAELKNLFRLIRHAMPIHPDILAAMAESKKVPSVLSYAWPEGDQLVEAQYRLVGLRRVDNVDYPLPEDAVPHIAASGDAAEFIKGLEPVLAAVAAGTHGGGPRTAESYRNAISAEFEAGPNLGTVLTYVEFISNFGPRVVSCPEPPDPAVKCRTIKEVIDRAGERDNRGDRKSTRLNSSH